MGCPRFADHGPLVDLPKAEIVISDTHGIIAHQIETLDDEVGFVSRHLQLTLRNGIGKLLEKEITRIKEKNAFISILLPNLFYPSSSPGQTAKTILVSSSGTRFYLTIDIVTVKEGKSPGCFLGRRRKSIDDQEKSQKNDGGKNPFSPHSVYL